MICLLIYGVNINDSKHKFNRFEIKSMIFVETFIILTDFFLPS